MAEQNKNEQEVPIHAYLSYRCKIPEYRAARESLINQCDDQNITLVYDEAGVQEGESLIAFMDDLTAARCVFLFLSPDYFQSAYTLFELVSIHERGDLDKRFILPVRVSKDMVTYQWTAAKQYLDDNEATRNELARLLNASDPDAVRQRVEAAWNSLIFPFLDELHSSLDQGDMDDILRETVAAARKAVNAAVEEEKQGLRDKVKAEIVLILERGFISVDRLKRELCLDGNVKDIARQLVEERDVGDAIALLTRIVGLQKERSKSEQWEECYYDAEQLCGWLLINSVDPVWWFHQQLKMKRAASKGIISNYSLTYQPYVEVIISRSLLQDAKYKLDAKGKIQPDSKYHDATLIFDGFSAGAADIELLKPIYKDLFRATEAPDKFEDLLQDIYDCAINHNRVRKGKPIYYLVGQKTLELFKSRSWFAMAQQKLAGNLQFVCCDVVAKNYDQSPCKENQKLLLGQLALLLSMRK